MNKEQNDRIRNACNMYYHGQNIASKNNEEKSKQELNGLLYAHCIAVGLLESVIKKYINVEGNTDEVVNEKLWLISAFYQGIEECESMIKCGKYVLAALILRQELEVLMKLYALDDGKYNKEKTGHPSAFKGSGRIYGNLSEIAHLLKDTENLFLPDKEMSGDTNGISLMPVMNKEICIEMYGLHIYMILCVFLNLESLFERMYGYEREEENEIYIDVIISTLIDYKFFDEYEIQNK